MRLTLLASLAMLGASQMAVAQTPEVQPASASTTAPAAPTWKYAPLADGALGWQTQGRPGKKEGSIQTYRFLYFAEPKLFDRKRVHWLYDEILLDCQANKVQILRGMLLDKTARKIGQSSSSKDPQPIAEKSVEFILKRMYCDGISLPTAKEAPSMDAAMEAVSGVKPEN